MLPNVTFRNIFAHIDGGIHPQSMAAGTTSGSPIALGGAFGFEKLLFRLLLTKGTANAAVSMFLQTATGSNGTFASLSQTLVTASISLASLYSLVIDTRDEAFCNLATGATWVQAVVALATTTTPLALDVLGWAADADPASTGDTATIVSEVDFY